MALSQLNANFLLKDVALLLYTLLISKGSQFLFKLKKIRPSSKVGPDMAGIFFPAHFVLCTERDERDEHDGMFFK